MTTTTLFTTGATATGGRVGQVQSADGVLDLELTMPKSLGGTGAPGTNPEQLFAAGYAACFASAAKLVAGQQALQTGPFAVAAEVTLGRREDGFVLSVTLKGSFPELDGERAQALMEATHQICPYSRATQGNVAVTLTVA
ncbi:MAG: Ohr family peroxiredoxin [Candidatus Sericytochromatia bacterium]|nr:Ohr family peroxiredoxin [Candidatus Sericytochromatia bacterium]